MGFLRNAKMIAEANRQMAEFKRLAPLDGSAIPPEAGLHQLANMGQMVGLTSGDCGKLAVMLLRGVDEAGSYTAAEKSILQEFETGRLTTLAGPPLNQFVRRQTVEAYLRTVGENFRPTRMNS